MLWYILMLYFAVINIIALIITVYDKIAAKRKMSRVPEKMLLFIGAAGGAPVMYIVMRSINHKVRHKKFMIGLPVIIVVQCLFVVFLLTKF